MSDNKAAVLIEIGTELIVNELKRRAAERGMTPEQLLAEADTSWNNAATAADDLANKGHEQ